jgi:ribosome recycling factor
MSDKTKPYEEKMAKTISNFQTELNTIRAGRANPHVLDKITVDYYGTPTPLNQVGNVTVPEARLIVSTPWDKAMLKPVEKALQASDLGINPTNDGTNIRLVFPELTEERRKSLTKDVKKKGEEFKVALRNVRRDAMDTFKKMEKKSEVTEDELKALEEEMQKLTDKYVVELDKLVDAKSKDILSI